MKPPLISPSPRPVSLKQSIPANLQTAFADEQWNNAANLARQRHRATKDPYYLAIEIAAKSQSDNVADRSACKLLVEGLVRDNTTIPDVDALDLYELACYRTDIKYSETIGILRARLVKASPKDQKSCVRCFDACVWNSDWKNAQQIATSLNKNFAGERKFLFRYILATHQFSMSKDCPDSSRKIFSSLARAQADKAFDSRLVPAKSGYHIHPTAVSESEAGLWLHIRVVHCSLEENLELFKKPQYSPLTFLDIGQREPYQRVLTYLRHCKAWDDLLQIGKAVIEEAIRISQLEAEAIEQDENVINLKRLAALEAEKGATEAESSVKKDLASAIEKARPRRSLKDYMYISSSCEYNLFRDIHDAAKYGSNSKRAFKQVRSVIDRLIRALTRAGSMRPIYQRTYDVFSLAISVARGSLVTPHPDGVSQRVVHITNHAFIHCDEPNSFNEVMVYMKWLTQPEIAVFITSLRARGIKCTDIFQRLMVTSLALRLRYIVATHSVLGTNGNRCGFCNAVMESATCIPCLKSIASAALETYRSGLEEAGPGRDKLSNHSQNPLAGITETGACSLLRLAGLGSLSQFNGTSPLYHTNIRMFLQAVIWLDSCLTISPPISNTHRMVLVKLYLLMGCVSRAKALWDPFDVKNSLLDSLGLMYIDRLSSIAPGLFLSSSIRDNPVDRFMVHFTKGLKTTTPKRIMDSLEQGSYDGVQGMIMRVRKQAASCTLVIAVVEERRGLRMRAGKVDITPIEDYDLVRKLSIDHDLKDITDYSIFNAQAAEVSDAQDAEMIPLHKMVNYGPLPTGTRAHLGLLSERFLDFVCYVQPKEYKPSRAGLVTQLDWEYASTTSCHLEEQMRILLGIADVNHPPEREGAEPSRRRVTEASLTASEYSYHKIIWRLVHAVKDTLTLAILSTSTNDSREHIRLLVNGILDSLKDQTEDFLDVPENIQSKLYAFHGFAALHAMGMLRESILAVKHTVHYLTMASEKARNVDKLRTSTELTWLSSEIKKLSSAAVESENTIKGRIKLLRTYLENVDGWRDRLCDWVFREYATVYDKDKEFKDEICEKIKAAIPKANAELWADEVGESWRELMKGWIAAKFD
ncbi:N-acetyltransferase B complex non catalytic subunit-domain-containing protein [Hypomontagnella monticulosa]|nr:N-acetyltransferase B complex non catalytic subunit-domain-containing protein [Hypomontagnella monticulosa]